MQDYWLFLRLQIGVVSLFEIIGDREVAELSPQICFSRECSIIKGKFITSARDALEVHVYFSVLVNFKFPSHTFEKQQIIDVKPIVTQGYFDRFFIHKETSAVQVLSVQCDHVRPKFTSILVETVFEASGDQFTSVFLETGTFLRRRHDDRATKHCHEA